MKNKTLTSYFFSIKIMLIFFLFVCLYLSQTSNAHATGCCGGTQVCTTYCLTSNTCDMDGCVDPASSSSPPTSSSPSSSPPTSSSPSSSPPAGDPCSKNEWAGCSGGTKRCVTNTKPACAGGGCGCYSNDCTDGSTQTCGGDTPSSSSSSVAGSSSSGISSSAGSSSSGGSSSSHGSTSSSGGSSSGAASSGCTAKTFKSASIVPESVTAGSDVMVKCNYGEDLNCISVTGAGLTNCTYRYFDKGDAVFLCKAPLNLGMYTSAVCKVSGSCCAQSNPVGTFYVVSTTPHYEQRMRLPAGTYTFSANVQALIVKGKGVVINLVCRSSTCFTGKIENSIISSISFPASGSFVNKNTSVTIPSQGGNKDYAVQISVQDGSEAYIDNVKLMLGSTNYVVNGEFNSSVDGSVDVLQPIAWGVANNRLGFYYGMAYRTVPAYVFETHPGSGDPGSGGSNNPSGGSGVLTGPSVNITLKIKIKLQGVAKKPAKADPIKVKLKLGGRALADSTAYQTGTFTPGDDGVWTGSVNFSVPEGTGYALFVKGPKHLQKKICDASPNESSGGTYHCSNGKISLKSGANDINLSGVLLLAGDLPGADGNQSGIVDTYDTTFIRQNLQSTEGTKLAIGDLNYDGIIDSQDYSLVVQSLGIKYDEE